ncbi:MAG: Nif3-like dinuclear metal center hexameric protein, partial [Saprospiraceae bacterium]|nr:Nif3-like dinuclear metal center hexameric protein [Saprospiraceae bacterium]
MILKEITDYLEKVAPLSLQESYDNAGLLIGDEEMEVTGALCTLDSTEDVLDEAISLGYNL